MEEKTVAPHCGSEQCNTGTLCSFKKPVTDEPVFIICCYVTNYPTTPWLKQHLLSLSLLSAEVMMALWPWSLWKGPPGEAALPGSLTRLRQDSIPQGLLARDHPPFPAPQASPT